MDENLHRVNVIVNFERLSDHLRAFIQAHPKAYNIQGTFISTPNSQIELIITYRELPTVPAYSFTYAEILEATGEQSN